MDESSEEFSFATPREFSEERRFGATPNVSKQRHRMAKFETKLE